MRYTKKKENIHNNNNTTTHHKSIRIPSPFVSPRATSSGPSSGAAPSPPPSLARWSRRLSAAWLRWPRLSPARCCCWSSCSWVLRSRRFRMWGSLEFCVSFLIDNEVYVYIIFVLYCELMFVIFPYISMYCWYRACIVIVTFIFSLYSVYFRVEHAYFYVLYWKYNFFFFFPSNVYYKY